MSGDDDRAWMANESQQLQATLFEALYGNDISDDEEQHSFLVYETDSDEYGESEEPFAFSYSPPSSPVHRAKKLDTSFVCKRERSRSRSPLEPRPKSPLELSDDVIIYTTMREHDKTLPKVTNMNFLYPNVEVSFVQTPGISGKGIDRGRVRSRGRGRGRRLGMERCHRVGKKDLQWNVGHPLQEIWLSDDDVPSELRQMARDVINRRLNERVKKEPEEVVDEAVVSLQREDLHFEWSPMETFQGKEEIFRPAHTGAVASYTSAYDAFRSYWDDSILQIIVNETNRYATNINSTSFQAEWYPTNVHEMLCLFAFWIMLGIIRMPTIQSCFTEHPLMKTTVFRHIFSNRRYSDLTRALHFVNEAAHDRNVKPPISDPDPIYSLRPIVDHLNAKFQGNYIPSQNICIDESLTPWKGKDLKHYVPSKAARYGIKTFELCESATGYLLSFIIYTGKETKAEMKRAPMASTGFALVKRLMGPLLNKGYRLFVGNRLNSPLLARFLKRNGTDCVGTIRPTLKDVPYLIAKAPLEKGQLLARHSGDVCVLAWEDKKRVTMISTCHSSATGLSHVHTNPVKPIPFKPQVVLDFLKSMGGVNLKDQMLEPYVIERKRCSKWYMKMFKRLLNVSILNARILLESSQKSRVDHLSFRLQIVDAILSRHLPQVPVTRKDKPQKPKDKPQKPAQIASVHDHWPVFLTKRTENERRDNRQARHRCVVCYSNGIRQKTTPFMCETCNVPLCAVNCFKAYHVS
ncbi:piggyBac transposable element-derived protein 4 [Manduca sexta]|uniref:PiggyBac transposable element-derived protein domain-containing protein n=1 Tax=Manduca sexta TaxID=7130 RepID=A0A921ZBL1_MANSE|nr:piggyBac transposable element-derived protein 4 [Manduca sexta]KAG6454575.1 hypothetical protein O3G_MSEX008779 [Manduca sexta]